MLLGPNRSYPSRRSACFYNMKNSHEYSLSFYCIYFRYRILPEEIPTDFCKIQTTVVRQDIKVGEDHKVHIFQMLQSLDNFNSAGLVKSSYFKIIRNCSSHTSIDFMWTIEINIVIVREEKLSQNEACGGIGKHYDRLHFESEIHRINDGTCIEF